MTHIYIGGASSLTHKDAMFSLKKMYLTGQIAIKLLFLVRFVDARS